MRDTVPDKVSKPVPREWRVDYSEETKQSAVLELGSNELTPNELCQKYGISRTTLYEWKIQYIGKGKSALNEDKKTKKSDYIKQIEELQSQKEAVERELSEMKNEMFYGIKWDDTEVSEFIDIVNEYMEWYREKRIKVSLGGKMSPMEYRRSL